jgi:hypothetical protein
LRCAAAVISEPYGVPAGSAEAPPVAGGSVAPAIVAVPIGEARLAKLALALVLVLVPVAAFITAEKAAVLSVAGATAPEAESISACSAFMRASTESMLIA